jgi:hypothetical protein
MTLDPRPYFHDVICFFAPSSALPDPRQCVTETDLRLQYKGSPWDHEIHSTLARNSMPRTQQSAVRTTGGKSTRREFTKKRPLPNSVDLTEEAGKDVQMSSPPPPQPVQTTVGMSKRRRGEGTTMDVSDIIFSSLHS